MYFSPAPELILVEDIVRRTPVRRSV